MRKMVAIDLGSSSIKGCAIDLESGAMETIHQIPFPDRLPHSDARRFEVDLHEVVSRTSSLLDKLLDEHRSIESIWFCSQMGGLVLADSKGSPLSHYFSWRDQRLIEEDVPGDSTWTRLRNRTLESDLWRSGNELQLGSTVALLFWLKERNQLPSQPVFAMQLGDSVASQLTHSPPRTQSTMALGTLDLETGERHHEWFERLGLTDVAWPTLLTTVEPVGYYSHGQRKIECYPAFGDHQSALAGVGLEEGQLSINVSTGSQVSRLTRALARGNYQTRPSGDGRFLNTITHLPAGRALNGLVELLCELPRSEGHPVQNPWTLIERAVDRALNQELLASQPTDPLEMKITFFAGPLGDSGHVSNIRLENLHVGHWFLAAYRSMARNYRECADRILGEQCPQSILFSGGFVQRSPRLKQLIAEQFEVPTKVIEGEEETLRGLLQMARHAR